MFSRATEESSRFDQVLALGRKLVEELDLESSADTLGRWMAHYLAELMDQAENASPEERAASKRRCSDAILELWSHRAELPDGKRPFEDLEPIIRAIESLDPENETPRYFASIRDAIDEAEGDQQVQSLLKVVRDMDSTARILISQTLVDAALSAVDKSKEWVALAEEAGADSGIVDVGVRFVSGEVDIEHSSDPNTRKRDLLKERIDRLETFTEMAKLFVDDLKKELKQADRSAHNSPPSSNSGPAGRG